MVYNKTGVNGKEKELKINSISRKWLKFKRRVQRKFLKKRQSRRKDNTYVSFCISK